MKRPSHILFHSRRRFLGLLAALGLSLPWPAIANPSRRLSRREAAFYRKGGRRQ